MGLGLLGRGLGDAVFLAECGAELIVTDLKNKKELMPSLRKLGCYKTITYRLGAHHLDDFRNRDMIVKAAGVPLDSPYIAEARKQGIPVEMDASLFARLLTPERSDGGQAKLAPKGVTLVGVTGTRGKSTTTALIFEILSSSLPRLRRGAEGGVVGSVYKGGNLVAEATLPLLKKVRAGDTIVLELDSWQLQGFGDAHISPQVSVFTNFTADHLNYYHGDMNAYFADKANIFRFQHPADYLICGAAVAERIRDARPTGKLVIAHTEDVPADWRIHLLGEHNLENIACAIAAARALGISDVVIKKAVEGFKGVPGRLEYLRTVRGVRIYNDNNATTPVATIAALKALGEDSRFKKQDSRNPDSRFLNPESDKHIVLIMGGTDKGLNMSELVEEIPKHCKGVILLKESGTNKIRDMIYDLGFRNKIEVKEKETLKECVEEAMEVAEKGDIMLFSPAFASFGKWFRNEYDRCNQFVELIEKL